jgi:MarR family transcriptional regulator, 2-MHQ and catechol-resistance regulon repressor
VPNHLLAKDKFLGTLRAMAETWQAFEAYSGAHIRTLGLTPPQFDIVATLGNTAGMTCKELGEKTLITKGTLTGVLDRLEAKKLIRRMPSQVDRRSVFICLTAKGHRLFGRVFSPHVGHCRCAFAALSAHELETLTRLLGRLGAAFRDGERAREAA